MRLFLKVNAKAMHIMCGAYTLVGTLHVTKTESITKSGF